MISQSTYMLLMSILFIQSEKFDIKLCEYLLFVIFLSLVSAIFWASLFFEWVSEEMKSSQTMLCVSTMLFSLCGGGKALARRQSNCHREDGDSGREKEKLKVCNSTQPHTREAHNEDETLLFFFFVGGRENNGDRRKSFKMENLLCINYKLLFSSFTRLTALSLLRSHFSPMFIKLQKNLLIENTHNFTQRTDETESWAPHSHDEGHNACWWSLRKWKSFVWFIFLALGLGEVAEGRATRARRRNLIDSLKVFDGIPDKKKFSLLIFMTLALGMFGWKKFCEAFRSTHKSTSSRPELYTCDCMWIDSLRRLTGRAHSVWKSKCEDF